MRNLIIGLVLIFFCKSCANPVPLTGGIKDNKAPQISLTEFSTPNFQTGFQEKRIILTFDEWISLTDVNNQLIISPPLQYKPKVYLKNKSLVLEWKDTLREDRTYHFQFGNSVRDFTENNPAENLNFVFSTGKEIDTCTLFGKIKDTQVNKGAEDTWVLIYPEEPVLPGLQGNPLYIAKTDKEGNYSFRYLKKGNYQLIALKDNNSNFKFDLENEKVAWLDSLVILPCAEPKFLYIQSDEPDLQLSSFTWKDSNWLTCKWNQVLQAELTYQMNGNETLILPNGSDSTDLYLPSFQDAMKLILQVKSLNLNDTIILNTPIKKSISSIAFSTSFQNEKNQLELFSDTIQTIFLSRPLYQIDAEKIKLNPELPFRIYLKNPSEIQFSFQIGDRKIDSTLTVNFLPGSILLSNNTFIEDSLHIDVSVIKKDRLPTVEFKITNAPKNSPFIYQLRNKKNRLIQYGNIIDQNLKLLLPEGNYTIRIIEDKDANNRYTGSSYLKKRRAEPVLEKSFQVKPNWDQTIEIDFNSN